MKKKEVAEQTVIRRKIDEVWNLFQEQLPAPVCEAGECWDQKVPMRDQTKLMTRVILPDGEGPWPVIAIRNPYTPVDSDDYMQIAILALVRYGYAIAYQQVRGLYHSEGDWYAFEREREDGLDFLTWIARQPWCDGRIGTYGGSYLGHVQWAMADAFPPQVKTMYALVWGDDPYTSFYENGMFKQGTWTVWATQMMCPDRRENLSIPNLEDYRKAVNVMPPVEADEALYGIRCEWFRNWLSNPCRSDKYWNQGVWDNYKTVASKIRIPVLLQTGWFDIFLEPTVRAFRHLDPETRSKSRLVIGPWHHGNTAGGVVGCPDENRFGFCQIRLALEWFEANLKGTAQEENGGMIDAYVMGEGWKRWNGADIPATSVRTLYLKHGADGVHHELKRDAAFKEEHLSYRYDPENPVMSCGGKLLTNYQKDGAEPECTAFQADVGTRDDVCSFLSERLDAPLRIAGETVVHLKVSSDAEDTAFTAKLMEETESGKTVNICDGVCSLTFRQGDDTRMPYTPGDEVELAFRLPPAAWLLKKDSRIRLDISSSNFPAFHRHPNRAGLWSECAEWKAAEQVLCLGGDSRIELPAEETT